MLRYCLHGPVDVPLALLHHDGHGHDAVGVAHRVAHVVEQVGVVAEELDLYNVVFLFTSRLLCEINVYTVYFSVKKNVSVYSCLPQQEKSICRGCALTRSGPRDPSESGFAQTDT